jgi:ribosomal protein S27E
VVDAAKPQRAWRAACPNCGAPVDFRSAASASAVCGFCRSTLVRDGDALRRIGQMAELFDDHSPLQLGVTGRFQGVTFTLVGRLQYAYREGTWNEWHALFDNGRSAWLSDDNGAYVLAFDRPAPADAPAVTQLGGLRAGQRVTVDGRAWDVASITRAKLMAAEGELPAPPVLDREFTVVDLRNAQGEVGTLDDQKAPAMQWSAGRSALLAELALQGLRESGEKSLAARSIECPNCGASLDVTLASTQSIACKQCTAVVDLSQGVGADLRHYVQNNADHHGAEPKIPLGATGALHLGAGGLLPWTVVGFMERCDLPAAGDDEEQTFWREYLLYNRTAGFAFLVDAEDGWSWVRPLTGAPDVRGNRARYAGQEYSERYTYAAKVTWVQGEFYWRVRRDERALVTDYEGTGGKKLSREQTQQDGASEVTWSAGEVLDAAVLAAAFKQPSLASSHRADAQPVSGGAGSTPFMTTVIVAFVLLVLLLAMCSDDDDCDDVRRAYGAQSPEHQQCQRSTGSGWRGGSGGSYGGWSSGGGHK